MTAKRRPRGATSRLDALEDAAVLRRIALEAAKEETWGRVFVRMTRADRQTVDALCDCLEENGPRWAEVRRLTDLASGHPPAHPSGEAARAWMDSFSDTPEGQPWPRPADPDGFASHFETEAVRADAVGQTYALAPELLTGARWAAAWWRMDALLCLEVGPDTVGA